MWQQDREPGPSDLRRRLKKRPDVRYEPSAPRVVEEMLWMGGVTEDDVVYDLGCGDGRIVIAAAELGARAVGIDVDERRLDVCRRNARIHGVTGQVMFLHQDLFEADLSEATVVMLYLFPDVNLRLRPKLLSELAPGTRVVSHSHDMGDWEPQYVGKVAGDYIYAWVVPPRDPSPS